MKNTIQLRDWIINSLFNKPILGKNYIDWHTEDGITGLTVMYSDKQFEILIREKSADEPSVPMTTTQKREKIDEYCDSYEMDLDTPNHDCVGCPFTNDPNAWCHRGKLEDLDSSELDSILKKFEEARR